MNSHANNPANMTSIPARTSRPSPIIDFDAVLARLDGDVELLVMLAEMFPNDSAQLFGQLCSSASTGNAADAERAAHSLKSLAANFDAAGAVAAAARIEQLAATGDLASAARAIPELESRIAELRQALARFCATRSHLN